MVITEFLSATGLSFVGQNSSCFGFSGAKRHKATKSTYGSSNHNPNEGGACMSCVAKD